MAEERYRSRGEQELRTSLATALNNLQHDDRVELMAILLGHAFDNHKKLESLEPQPRLEDLARIYLRTKEAPQRGGAKIPKTVLEELVPLPDTQRKRNQTDDAN
jgi:hypothetical protein